MPATTRIGALKISASRNVIRISSATWSAVMLDSPYLLRKALEQRVSQKIPTVHHDEEQDLQRSGDGHGRELQHADGSRDRCNDQIDEQKRQEEYGADLKTGLQFRKHVRRNDNT